MRGLLERLLKRTPERPPTTFARRPFATAEDSLERCDLGVAVADSAERRLVHGLARTVVLAAESVRAADDRYHLVVRPRGEAEATLIPLGPHLNALGERAELELARTALDGRTALWLCLPARVAVAEVVDPAAFDPETEAALDALVAAGGVRWAAAATLARHRRQVLARMILWLPAAGAEAVESAGGRLGEAVSGG